MKYTLKASTGVIAAIAVLIAAIALIAALTYLGVITIPLTPQTSTTEPSTSITTYTTTIITTTTTEKTNSTTIATATYSSTLTSSTSPTITSPSQSKIILPLQCKAGSIEEAALAYSRSHNYCWGWLGTHTYDLGNPLRSKWLSGKVAIGPSEGGRHGVLYIEISRDGEEYANVYSREVGAGETVEFNISLNTMVQAVRLRVEPAPMNTSWVSIDYSDLRLSIDTGNHNVVQYYCGLGEHLEAKEAYNRSGNYCWGWITSHTYKLGNGDRLDYAIVYVRMGPTGFTGSKNDIIIQVSMDGENWKTLENRKIFLGGPITVMVINGNHEPFTYFRIKCPHNGYIDYSRGYLLTTP